MQSRCNGPILLGAITISVVLATMKPDVMKKPFGPKMGARLCNRIAGCSSYIYRTFDLSCHPKSVMQQNQDKGIYLIKVIKDKERIQAENAVNCSEDDRIFRSRRHVIQCKPVLQNHSNLSSKEDKTKGRMTRILMMPFGYGDLHVRQLYLANNSIVTYPFLEFQKLGAMAYIPSQRKLILATRKPNLIVLVPVDEDKKTVLKTKYIIKGMTIDDDKQLVFIIIKHTFHTVFVGVMTTHGTNLTIFSRHMSCQLTLTGGVVADHMRSLIYVSCEFSKILKFTYQGVPKGHVAGAEAVGYRVLYMKGEFLYCVSRTSFLVKASLSNHTKVTTKKLPSFKTILNVGSILYINPSQLKSRTNLLVVNMSDMGTVTKLKTGFGMNVCYIIMCLIP